MNDKELIMFDLQRATALKKEILAHKPKNSIGELEKESSLWTANHRIKYLKKMLKG